MIGAPSGHSPPRVFFDERLEGARLRLGMFGLEVSFDHRRAQVQPGPCEDLGDPDLAHHRTELLQSADQILYEFRERIDHPRDPGQGFTAGFLDPLHPGRKGLRTDHEHSGCLRIGQVTGRLQFQDRHLLGLGVMRPKTGRHPHHAGILDSKLFAEEQDFGVGLLQLSGQPDFGEWALGCPSPGTGDIRGLSEGHLYADLFAS